MKKIDFRNLFWVGFCFAVFGVFELYILMGIFGIPLCILGGILILISRKSILAKILTILFLLILPFLLIFGIFALGEM